MFLVIGAVLALIGGGVAVAALSRHNDSQETTSPEVPIIQPAATAAPEPPAATAAPAPSVATSAAAAPTVAPSAAPAPTVAPIPAASTTAAPTTLAPFDPSRVTGYNVTSTLTSYSSTSTNLPPRRVGLTQTYAATCTDGACTVGGRSAEDVLTLTFTPLDQVISVLQQFDDQCGPSPGYNWTGMQRPTGEIDLRLDANATTFSPADIACVNFAYTYDLVLVPILS